MLSFLSRFVSVGNILYVVTFAIGFLIAQYIYSQQIENIKFAQIESNNLILKESQKKYEEREREILTLTQELHDEKTKHNNSVRNLESALYRLQHPTNAPTNNRTELPKTSTVERVSDREQLQACQRLLTRGAELLVRGTDLAGAIAIDKDTIVKLHNITH